jgi:hypothetical protein
MANISNENLFGILNQGKSEMNSGWLIFTGILSCLFVTYIISNSVLALEYNASTNASEITGFSQNNSIRNLTNPVLKMERNPLANLSNPLANLSNPLDNLSKPLSNFSKSTRKPVKPLTELAQST